MRQIVNLLVFLGIFFLFYTYGLQKKGKVFMSHLKLARGMTEESRQDSVKSVVENRIREDVCPIADLSEYRGHDWSDYGKVDASTSTITHTFTCDAKERKFLFRIRDGIVSEIVDLR